MIRLRARGLQPRRRSRRPASIAVAAFLLLAAACGRAADVDLTELPIESLLAVEVRTVSGAAKHEQTATRAPAAVSVITAEEIRRFGWLDLGEALRALPGFHESHNRNYQFLGVRGFSRPGDFNSRVLVLIDGHRINDSVYGQGSTEAVFPLDMDLVDRIEVIRGPGSALYGSGAFFAVINVIPKSAAQVPGLELAGRAGSGQAWQGRVSSGARFASGLEIVASASGMRGDGDRALRLPDLVGSAVAPDGVSRNSDGEAWQNAYLGLKWGEWKFTAIQGQRDKQYGTGTYSTVAGDGYSGTSDGHQLVDLQWDHALDGGRGLHVRTAYHWYWYRSPMHLSAAPTVPYREVSDSQWWSTEVRYDHRLGERHRLALGAEYARHFENRQTSIDVTPYALYLDVNRPYATSALFLQDEIALTSRWTVTLGLRHDRLSGGQSPLSPRAAAVYSPDDATAVKLLYGTAFRAPNAYELYYEVPGSVAANPALRPEKIRTTELVLERALGAHGRGTASVYEYRVDHLVSQTVDGGGLAVFENLDSVRARGVELGLEGRWPSLVVRGSVGAQRVRDESIGQRLSNAPPVLGKASLLLPFHNDRASLALEARHTASRYGDVATGDRPLLGGFTVVDLTLVHAGLARSLELTAAVRNVFDRRYGDPTSADDMAGLRAIPRDGRTWWFKARLGF